MAVVIDRMNERPKNAGAAMENIWSLCLFFLVLLTAVVYLSAEKYEISHLPAIMVCRQVNIEIIYT